MYKSFARPRLNAPFVYLLIVGWNPIIGRTNVLSENNLFKFTTFETRKYVQHVQKVTSQPAFAGSKSTIETLEQCVRSAQS